MNVKIKLEQLNLWDRYSEERQDTFWHPYSAVGIFETPKSSYSLYNTPPFYQGIDIFVHNQNTQKFNKLDWWRFSHSTYLYYVLAYTLGEIYGQDRWKLISTRSDTSPYFGLDYESYMPHNANLYTGRMPVQSPIQFYQGNQLFKNLYGPIDMHGELHSELEFNWPLIAHERFKNFTENSYYKYDFQKNEILYKSFLFNVFFSYFDLNFFRQPLANSHLHEDFLDWLSHPRLSTALVQFKDKLYMTVSPEFYQNISFFSSIVNFRTPDILDKNFPFPFERSHLSYSFGPYIRSLHEAGLFESLVEYYIYYQRTLNQESFLYHQFYNTTDEQGISSYLRPDSYIFIEFYDEVLKEIRNIFKKFEDLLDSGKLFELTSFKQCYIDQHANDLSTYNDCYGIVGDTNYQPSLSDKYLRGYRRSKPQFLTWGYDFYTLQTFYPFEGWFDACMEYRKLLLAWNSAFQGNDQSYSDLNRAYTQLCAKYEYFDLFHYYKSNTLASQYCSVFSNHNQKTQYYIDSLFTFLTTGIGKEGYQRFCENVRFRYKRIKQQFPFLLAE